ncbi:MAG: glycosyltransferase [bacterium]|nr:glycosyltransferase [bacterium]
MINKGAPLVSVVMPVYNGQKYLAEAIESVLNQTYSIFEFIIVDDGSSDKSKMIIEKHERSDSRIQYIGLKRNGGISNALNIGIKAAKGEYVARMDCDDIIPPERFLKQVAYFQKHFTDVDVLGTYFCLFQNGLIDVCREVPAYAGDVYNGKPPVHHPTCMIKRRTFLDHGYYNSKFNNAEDVELWFRWFSQGVKFHNIPQVLYRKRIHEGSVSISKMSHQIYLLLRINIIAISKYRMRFSAKGYLRILEQTLYLVYLFLRLDRFYVRDKSIYHLKRKSEYGQ